MAAQWALETADLGYAQTGMSMEQQTALALRLPPKKTLLDYAHRAFAAAQQAFETIGDHKFYAIYETLHGENWHDGHLGPS